MSPPTTIAELLRDAEGDEAVLLSAEGLALSGTELAAVTAGLASQLRAVGVEDGRAVASVVPNGPAAALVFLAGASVGAAAPLNPAAPAAEVAFLLDDLAPAAVVVASSEASHPIVELARERSLPIVRVDTTPAMRLSGEVELPPTASDTAPRHPTPPGTALLLHTSGTTGRPKLVPLTGANLLTSAGNVARSLGLGAGDRCLNVMPLFHIHGLVAGLLAPLVSGGSVVCTPGFHSPRVLAWIEATGATWYTAVPTMHAALVARSHAEGRSAWPASLRVIRSSSSALPPTVAADLERLAGVPVIEAYGMTEAAHQICSNPLPPGVRRPGSVGPAAGPEVAVLDDEGVPAPTGTTGEVAIRGPNVTPGYVGGARRSEDEWFRTGDVGVLDAAGSLTLTGRRKELINRGGETIAPREIDEALLDHPQVAEAVAFAVPDAALGEVVAAAVVARPGPAPDPRELRSFVAGRLSPAKVPATIVIVDELPLGPSGKVLRIGMAERLGVPSIHRPSATGVGIPDDDPTLVRLQALWGEVLEREVPGPDDDFLDLGGDSMLATRLLGRVRAELGSAVDALDFLDAATCREQAALLTARPAAGT